MVKFQSYYLNLIKSKITHFFLDMLRTTINAPITPILLYLKKIQIIIKVPVVKNTAESWLASNCCDAWAGFWLIGSTLME